MSSQIFDEKNQVMYHGQQPYLSDKWKRNLNKNQLQVKIF